MLYAVAIYNCTDEEKPTLVTSAQRRSSFSTFFDGDLLVDLKKESLPKAIKRRESQPASLNIDIYPHANEHHYIQRLTGDASHLYIAVCAQRSLTQIEANRLFHNIALIYQKPTRVSATLQSVVDNYLQFITPKDVLMQQIGVVVDELKCKMLENIEIALERGEKIDLLVEKARDLDSHAVKFEKEARKAKPWCGGC